MAVIRDTSLHQDQPGLLVAHYGSTLIVENKDGQLFPCKARKTLGPIVTGDEVLWQQLDETSGVVVACLPRHSVIERPQRRGTKPLVANVDQMILVVALEPLPHLTTLTRYLALAEILKLPVLIAINKMDLLASERHNAFLDQLSLYQALGYQSLQVSCKSKTGLPELQAALGGKRSILVGQSGVGKSSLLNVLVPEAQARTQALSKHNQLGRQTTTSSRLYHLPTGGDLIDSPGIHQFYLTHFTPSQLFTGFREFQPYVGKCQFRDCSHRAEPGCALQAAVKKGEIAEFRLQHYHALVEESNNY